MKPHRVTVPATFALTRSIEFLAGFPPTLGDLVLGPGSITGAFAIGDRAVPYTVTQPSARALAVETPEPAVVPMVAAFLGVDDAIARFYRSAAGDVPAFRRLVDELRGLHHVRFRTLEEVTVHAVLCQRTPIGRASALKRKVSDALGPRVEHGGHTLIAFPTFDRLAALEPAEWAPLVGNVAKARRLPGVVRGVAQLGAAWLAAAPYAEARDALCAIDGVGPFSAAMILLRGLGRMDDVPLDIPGIAKVGQAVYGAAWDPAAIRARYGADLGTWSFYLKAGEGRVARRRRAS